jgi:hypothetical protein
MRVLERVVGEDVRLSGVQPRTVPGPEAEGGYTSWVRAPRLLTAPRVAPGARCCCRVLLRARCLSSRVQWPDIIRSVC